MCLPKYIILFKTINPRLSKLIFEARSADDLTFRGLIDAKEKKILSVKLLLQS